MTSLLLTGIGSLVTNDPARGDLLGEIHDAALVIEGSKVAWVGSQRDAPAADSSLDVGGRAVIPGFVDSHSHLVFAGDRAEEFAARMTGTPYSAGGIRTTVAATRQATDEQLTANVARLVTEMRRQGTTTVEIKSGYGLTVGDEARALEIAGHFTDETTYLGAHVVPAEYADDPAGYVSLVTGPMLDAAAEYAKWVDVFVERGAFDEDQGRAILEAGLARGLQARVHANQLGEGPGVQLACSVGAAAADHCTYLTDADIDALASTASSPASPRDRVLHAFAVPERPTPDRRRRHRSPRHRLQPGLRLLLFHALLHRPGRPRNAHDARRGPLVRHRRRRRVPPPK